MKVQLTINVEQYRYGGLPLVTIGDTEFNISLTNIPHDTIRETDREIEGMNTLIDEQRQTLYNLNIEKNQQELNRVTLLKAIAQTMLRGNPTLWRLQDDLSQQIPNWRENKIPAIKYVRHVVPIGLREAKLLVEFLIEVHESETSVEPPTDMEAQHTIPQEVVRDFYDGLYDGNKIETE